MSSSTLTLPNAQCLFAQCKKDARGSKGLTLKDIEFTQSVKKTSKGNVKSTWIVRGLHEPCGRIVTKFVAADLVPAERRGCDAQAPETPQSECEIQPLI